MLYSITYHTFLFVKMQECEMDQSRSNANDKQLSGEMDFTEDVCPDFDSMQGMSCESVCGSEIRFANNCGEIYYRNEI